MITLFLFPNIWLKGNCLYYLGEGAYEKQTPFVSLGRSLYYRKEYLQEIMNIYEDFLCKFSINEL